MNFTVYNKYWWCFCTYGNLSLTDFFFTFVFCWKLNPHLFRKAVNHCWEALKLCAAGASPESATSFLMVIRHQTPVSVNPRARFAVIRLTSSSCCLINAPLLCWVYAPVNIITKILYQACLRLRVHLKFLCFSFPIIQIFQKYKFFG